MTVLAADRHERAENVNVFDTRIVLGLNGSDFGPVDGAEDVQESFVAAAGEQIASVGCPGYRLDVTWHRDLLYDRGIFEAKHNHLSGVAEPGCDEFAVG